MARTTPVLARRFHCKEADRAPLASRRRSQRHPLLRSGLVRGELGDRGADGGLRWHARGLEAVGEADARDVRACEEPRRRVQLVEQILDNLADQVLAEVGHLGVLVAAQHAVGLLDACLLYTSPS